MRICLRKSRARAVATSKIPNGVRMIPYKDLPCTCDGFIKAIVSSEGWKTSDAKTGYNTPIYVAS